MLAGVYAETGWWTVLTLLLITCAVEASIWSHKQALSSMIRNDLDRLRQEVKDARRQR